MLQNRPYVVKRFNFEQLHKKGLYSLMLEHSPFKCQTVFIGHFPIFALLFQLPFPEPQFHFSFLPVPAN